jgi:hypothetical protein
VSDAASLIEKISLGLITDIPALFPIISMRTILSGFKNGATEKYVGEFISSERERFVVTTKNALTTNPDDPNASGNHRKNLVQSVDASLKRLSKVVIS